MCKQGLKVIKFERNGNVSYDGSKMKGDKYVGPTLEYEFIILILFLLHQCPSLMIHLLF
jgi:hypothetical protein